MRDTIYTKFIVISAAILAGADVKPSKPIPVPGLALNLPASPLLVKTGGLSRRKDIMSDSASLRMWTATVKMIVQAQKLPGSNRGYSVTSREPHLRLGRWFQMLW